MNYNPTARISPAHLALAALIALCFAQTAIAQVATEAWVQRYDGPGGTNDRAQAVAVDGSGNVFVTGYSYDVATGEDYVTVAYTAAGVPIWTNRYNGPGNGDDRAHAVTVDGSGKVFVTGFSLGSSSSLDFTTLAYSGAGQVLWTNHYNGSGNAGDVAYAVGVDVNGKVFVTGESWGSSGLNDFATVAYSGLGEPLWTNRYNGPANGLDYGLALAVDEDGNVIVTGDSGGVGGSQDYATVAYSGAGVALWTNRYDGPGNLYDSALAVAVDESGMVVVTGFSNGGGTSQDYATIAYDSGGLPLWTNRYNGPGNNYDSGNAVAVGEDGTVFVTGTSTDVNYDYTTIAYSGAGTPLWTNRYDGPVLGFDEPSGLLVDANGTVFVTGASSGTNTYPLLQDYATIAYSGLGVPLWTNRYNGPGNGDDRPDLRHPLALTPNGVVVVGYSDGDTGLVENNDYAVVKYTVSFSQSVDSDGDGLNDLAEVQLGALGFNWQSNNAALVSTLFSNAPTAGLFTQAQLQGLAVNSPLIARDSVSGLFKLTIGVQKSTNLTNFVLFPMTAPQTSINATGQVEFQFASSNGAAFYRLEAR